MRASTILIIYGLATCFDASACPALMEKAKDVRYLLCSEGLYDVKLKAYVFNLDFNGIRMSVKASYSYPIESAFQGRDPEYASEELAMLRDEINPVLLFFKKDLNSFIGSRYFSLVHVVAEDMIDQNFFAIGKAPERKWVDQNCGQSNKLTVCEVSYVKPRAGQKAYYSLDSAAKVKNITILYQ